MGLIPGSGRSPGGGMATHSSILAWRISWTEEPGGLQSMRSHRDLKQLSTHSRCSHLMNLRRRATLTIESKIAKCSLPQLPALRLGWRSVSLTQQIRGTQPRLYNRGWWGEQGKRKRVLIGSVRAAPPSGVHSWQRWCRSHGPPP